MFVNRPNHLVELLHWRAEHQAGEPAFSFRAGEGLETDWTTDWTYDALDRHARAAAVEVLAHASAGHRALLLCPAGSDFVSAFLGCLYAGVVPIPAYPPLNARQVPRIAALLRDARTDLILTNRRTRERIEKWL